MQHELPSARLPHHSGDDAAGGLPSLGSSPKMEPKVVGRTSAEVEAAAASLHLEAYGEEEPEEMWEQMSPRVYRNLDEIFAGEYEGMRCAMGNSGGAILRANLRPSIRPHCRYADIKHQHKDEAELRAMDKIGPCHARSNLRNTITATPLPPSDAPTTLSRLPLPARRVVLRHPLAPRPAGPRDGVSNWVTPRTRRLLRVTSPTQVHEMESYKEPLLIVSHQAVLRCLYAYLMNLPRGQCPKLEIPLHTVMKITYDGWNPPSEERFILGPDPLEALDGEVTDERTKRGPCSPRDGQKHL